jgi:hypothetical protein
MRSNQAIKLIMLIAFCGADCVAETPPPPRTPYHLLLGPYEYELNREQKAQILAFSAKRYKSFEKLRAAMAALPHGKRVPRYYTLDDRHYRSIDALKAAIATLPAGSTLYLRGDCSPEDAINLPPHPITLPGLRSYCSRYGITFTWTFGPGGY